MSKKTSLMTPAQIEHRRLSNARYYQKNREKLIGDVVAAKARRRAKLSPAEREVYNKRECDWHKRHNANRRLEVMNAYGGPKCACCGETELKFLSLDHVFNNGAEHRREQDIGGGDGLYRWLKKHGFPAGFQVLCMNCNHGKHRNGGICPHQDQARKTA